MQAKKYRLAHGPLLAATLFTLALTGCKPQGSSAVWVFEADPEHVEETVEVLRQRLGKRTRIEAAGAGRIHVSGARGIDADLLRRHAETRGELELLIEAQHEDWAGIEADAARRAFLEWHLSHPTAPPSAYPAPAPEDGGTPPAIAFALRTRGGPGGPPSLDQVVALVRSPDPEWRFTHRDILRVRLSQDGYGLPAFEIELARPRAERFASFTAAHVGRNLAVVLDGEALTLAHIAMPLSGRTVVSGGSEPFTRDEMVCWVWALRSGPLPAPVRFVEVLPTTSAGEPR